MKSKVCYACSQELPSCPVPTTYFVMRRTKKDHSRILQEQLHIWRCWLVNQPLRAGDGQDKKFLGRCKRDEGRYAEEPKREDGWNFSGYFACLPRSVHMNVGTCPLAAEQSGRNWYVHQVGGRPEKSADTRTQLLPGSGKRG